MNRYALLGWLWPFLALSVACSRDAGPSTLPMPTTPAATGVPNPEGTVDQPQEQDVWVESRVRRPMTSDFAHAITVAGEAWVYTDVINNPDAKPGQFTFAPSSAWQRRGTLSHEEKAELADALVRADIAHLPAEPPPRKDSVIGGTEILWTIRMGGTTYRLRRISTGAGSVPDLDPLDRLVAHLTYLAQQRTLHEKPAP